MMKMQVTLNKNIDLFNSISVAIDAGSIVTWKKFEFDGFLYFEHVDDHFDQRGFVGLRQKLLNDIYSDALNNLSGYENIIFDFSAFHIPNEMNLSLFQMSYYYTHFAQMLLTHFYDDIDMISIIKEV